MSNIKLFLNLFIALVFISCVSASNDFNLSGKPLGDIINFNESATYVMTITNNMDKSADFLTYAGDVEWDVTPVPLEDRQITIRAHSSEDVVLSLTPIANMWPNKYGVSVRVKNLETQEVIAENLFVEVKPNLGTYLGEYEPAINPLISFHNEIDPSFPVNVQIVLINQNNLDLPKVTLHLKSRLVDKEFETSLKGLETKTLNYSIQFDRLTTPQDDVMQLDVVATRNDSIDEFKAPSVDYSIIPYSRLVEDSTITSSFLKKYTTYTLTNDANVAKEYKFTLQKKFFSGMYLIAYPRPEIIKINGHKFYSWQGSLERQGTTTINITENYRWILYLVVIVLFTGTGYLFLRSPVVVTKSAKIIGRSDEGIIALRVRLNIKNRTSHTLYGVEIRDKVSNIFTVEKKFPVGSVEPTNILNNEQKGAIIRWDAEEFSLFEERVITYKIHAKLSIVDEFTFPAAVIKYKTSKTSRHRSAQSNKFIYKTK